MTTENNNLYDDLDLSTGEPKKSFKNYLRSFQLLFGVFLLKVTGLDVIIKRNNFQLRHEMFLLRQDMKTLYQEMSSDVERSRKEIRRIKPILKIEDPEAVKFIKDILSTHDKKLNTQQEFLSQEMITLKKLANKVEAALEQRTATQEQFYVNVKEIIKNKAGEKVE